MHLAIIESISTVFLNSVAIKIDIEFCRFSFGELLLGYRIFQLNFVDPITVSHYSAEINRMYFYAIANI